MVEQSEYVRHRVYVDVLGADLWIAEDSEGELYFPVRPSCKALELDSTSALETVKEDSRLNTGLRKIRLPTGYRGEQEQQCLSSIEYAWWLALIDPRRFAPERRPLLQERQKTLMGLARDIMLRRSQVPRIAPAAARGVDASGALEGHFRCLKCGAPHLVVIDGNGWHMHLATPETTR